MNNTCSFLPWLFWQFIVLKILPISYGYTLSELTHFAPHKHCNSVYFMVVMQPIKDE